MKRSILLVMFSCAALAAMLSPVAAQLTCCPGCDPLFPFAPTIPYVCSSPPGGTFETCP